MQLHLIELQEKIQLVHTSGNSAQSVIFFQAKLSTHKISEQMHVIFLDPVAEDLCCSIALGEDQLDQSCSLLLG